MKTSQRTYDYPVLDVIKERWSARAFDERVPTEAVMMSCLEAARYAPSCYNEQPWRYLLPRDQEELQLLQKLLYDGNREWADRAPYLLLLLSKKTFAHKEKANRFHAFDAGTSFGFFALQATAHGLIAHPMAGFRAKTARQTLAIPDDYEVLCMVAVGYHGDKEKLASKWEEQEKPGTREALGHIVFPVGHWKDREQR